MANEIWYAVPRYPNGFAGDGVPKYKIEPVTVTKIDKSTIITRDERGLERRRLISTDEGRHFWPDYNDARSELIRRLGLELAVAKTRHDNAKARLEAAIAVPEH